MRKAILAAVMILGAATARAQDYSVDGASSSITYHLVHKFHKIDGVSKKVTGKVKLAGAAAQIMVVAPSESFDSGNVNRDEHMKETVEAAKFPTIELKALADGVAVPASFPATVDKTVKAQLTFHGVAQKMDVPVKITFESATKVKATSSYTISLDAFKIERPSLMFVKVDDKLDVDANVVFTK